MKARRIIRKALGNTLILAGIFFMIVTILANLDKFSVTGSPDPMSLAIPLIVSFAISVVGYFCNMPSQPFAKKKVILPRS